MDEYEHERPLLERGEKVLIVTRRLFETQLRRHFLGLVEHYDGNAMRVRGYAFICGGGQGGFVRRKSQRTRIFSIDNHIIVFLLPQDTDLGSVRYEVTAADGLIVTDAKQFKLEMNEFNA